MKKLCFNWMTWGMPSKVRLKKIMEKLNRAPKCSILGPQNLGSGGAAPTPPPDPHLSWVRTGFTPWHCYMNNQVCYLCESINRELRLKFQRKMLIITLMSLTLVITNWQYWWGPQIWFHCNFLLTMMFVIISCRKASLGIDRDTSWYL